MIVDILFYFIYFLFFILKQTTSSSKFRFPASCTPPPAKSIFSSNQVYYTITGGSRLRSSSPAIESLAFRVNSIIISDLSDQRRFTFPYPRRNLFLQFKVQQLMSHPYFVRLDLQLW
ncbi:hypothetical protein HHK36_007799 [Tetracentron sinense]|uniref:Uncharacterized protein n=1 Tax=Tetracentron sinense TaxID=13715 RepID=A0A835DMM6_TETSI|nr:hypothetical protein HHK36_007799 [Tetracentron sinense]